MLKAFLAVLLLSFSSVAVCAQTAEETFAFIAYEAEEGSSAPQGSMRMCEAWHKVSTSPLRFESRACSGKGEVTSLEIVQQGDSCTFGVKFHGHPKDFMIGNKYYLIEQELTFKLADAKYGAPPDSSGFINISAPTLVCGTLRVFTDGQMHEKSDCIGVWYVSIAGPVAERAPAAIARFRDKFCKGLAD